MIYTKINDQSKYDPIKVTKQIADSLKDDNGYNIQDLARKKDFDQKNNRSKNVKAKRKRKQKQKTNIFVKLFQILLTFVLIALVGIYVFFKTNLFQKYKELWVETAMSTMNHQYLATWFLTDSEIQEILDSLKVINTEDSDVDNIIIDDSNSDSSSVENIEKKEITLEKITGKGYVGFVLQIPDPTMVKLVDSRNGNYGTKLSKICEKYGAIAGINAGGFVDPDGTGNGNQLNKPTIINKKMLYGSKSIRYSWIGLTEDSKLILGNYTYEEAMAKNMVSGLEFGPFLIVNGNDQINNSNSGGIHPRTAIGQKQDGTIVFVVIDGRQPGYSIGTNLLELQNIFKRYDVINAANLDGGSSSTMYYNGSRVNKTSTPIGERYLPTAFIAVDK